ncbi:MAG: efflux RND transporter periplasmic adaptor subunit [Deltaproteobacteria bacterium]|nr:efflux RND transporter periplasmic adaptor subunit [Deltaproteobacteria bacterium]
MRTAPRFGVRLPALFLTAALGLGPAACGEKTAYTPPPPPKVTVAQPVRQPVTDHLEFTGNTQAVNTVQLRARVEGYLEQVLFKDGEQVQKGQLLFLIQQNTYQAKLKKAEADILGQKARLLHARQEFARYSTLVKQKAASQSDVDKWQFERDAAQAALLAAEAQRDLAKLDLGYTRVSAPFAGRIDRRLKDPGNLVGAGGEETVLAEINQIDPIYVYFTVSERDLLRLRDKADTPLEKAPQESLPVFMGLANEKDYPHRGRLDFAAITVTQTTGTLLLRGVFANPESRILPGLFARVRVPVSREKPALLVPQVALAFDQLGSYVLIVNEKNVVERRGVTLGAQVNELRVVASGLTGDERVVVKGLLRAIPGRRVQPETAGQPKPPASDGQKAGT